MAISWLSRGISGTSGQGVEELASEVNRWNVGLLLKNADTGTTHSARKIREMKRLIVSMSEAWSEYLLLIYAYYVQCVYKPVLSAMQH